MTKESNIPNPTTTSGQVTKEPSEKIQQNKPTVQNLKNIFISVLPTIGFLILFTALFSALIAARKYTQPTTKPNPNLNLKSTPTSSIPTEKPETITVLPTKFPTISPTKDCTNYSDPANTGVYDSKDVRTFTRLSWFRKGDPKSLTVGGAAASPVIACGTLYFNNWDGYVYALNAKNGSVIWRFKPEGNPVQSPVFETGFIYFGDRAGNFYAVNTKTQREVWRYSLKTEKHGIKLYGSRQITSPPLLYNNTIYFPDNSGYLYALDALDGSEKWIFEKQKVFYFSAPAISEGIAYFGDDDGIIYAVDAKTGTEKWEYTSTDSVSVQPTIYNGKIYVISDDGVLHALNVENGSELWNYKYQKTDSVIRVNPNPIAAYKGSIYLSGTNDYFLDVLDSETGRQLWKFQAESWVESQPVIADNILYFGTNERKNDYRGYLYAVDINSHKELWKYKIAYLGLTDKPFIWEGVIYIIDGNGNLFALE